MYWLFVKGRDGWAFHSSHGKLGLANSAARELRRSGDKVFIATAKTVAQLLNGLDFMSMAINGEPMRYREDY